MKNFIQSFGFAFEGIGIAFKEEFNFRIHTLAMFVIVILGVYFDVSEFHWLVMVICIGLVLFAELMNTSIENLCDHMSTEHDPRIKKIKDLSAAAVFIVALTAATVGALIFIPEFLELIR